MEKVIEGMAKLVEAVKDMDVNGALVTGFGAFCAAVVYANANKNMNMVRVAESDKYDENFDDEDDEEENN